MSENQNLNELSSGTGDFSSNPSDPKAKKIKTISEILEKKQREIVENAVKNNVPDADIIKVFSLRYQQNEIDDKALLTDYELLGFDVNEIKVTAVKLDVHREYYYEYNKVLLLLATPYENTIEFEVITGKIKVSRDIEEKLMPIIEEIRLAKMTKILDDRETELAKREEKLAEREEKLSEKERELEQREEMLRSKEAELKQLVSEIAKTFGLFKQDEEDP